MKYKVGDIVIKRKSVSLFDLSYIGFVGEILKAERGFYNVEGIPSQLESEIELVREAKFLKNLRALNE